MTTTQPSAHEPHPAKPWYKKWWVITIGVVLALGIIGNLIDDGTDDQVATPAETTPPAVVETAAEPSPDHPTPASEMAAPETTSAEAAPAETEVASGPGVTEPIEPTQPDEEPELTDDQRVDAIRVVLGEGEEWAPTWTLPITDMQAQGDTLFVNYQETLADEEKVQLGQYLHNFLRAAPENLGIDTFVITDTSGLDFNVWCGRTICADSVMDIDS